MEKNEYVIPGYTHLEPVSLFVTDENTKILQYSNWDTWGDITKPRLNSPLIGSQLNGLNNRRNKTRKGFRILEIKESRYFALML